MRKAHSLEARTQERKAVENNNRWLLLLLIQHTLCFYCRFTTHWFVISASAFQALMLHSRLSDEKSTCFKQFTIDYAVLLIFQDCLLSNTLLLKNFKRDLKDCLMPDDNKIITCPLPGRRIVSIRSSIG